MARGAAPPLDPVALKDARLDAGLSQDALARTVGTDRRQIIRYEQGAERPEIARLAALARACSATVEDLVVDGTLPPGLAGLRIGAGLTMAAAAAALGDRLEEDVATNRASLSYAERGRMPLSWQGSIAGIHVRSAMSTAYGVELDRVKQAWVETFREQQARSLNPTSSGFAVATQTPPPKKKAKWKPLSAWLWERLVQVTAAGPGGADDEWTGGARWQEHLSTRERARGTTGRGYIDDDTPGQYWLTEVGRAHIIDRRDDYAQLYPDIRQPQAVRELDTDTVLRDADPDTYSARAVWGTARPASQTWTIKAQARALTGSVLDVVAHGREGSPATVRWHRDDASGGVRAPRVDQVLEVTEWSSPWRAIPGAAPDLPGARPDPGDGAVELPLEAADIEIGAVTLNRATGADIPELLADLDRVYRVATHDRLLGWVWRDQGGKEWAGLRAGPDGTPVEILAVAPRSERRTRTQAVGLLVERAGEQGPSRTWWPVRHPSQTTDTDIDSPSTSE